MPEQGGVVSAMNEARCVGRDHRLAVAAFFGFAAAAAGAGVVAVDFGRGDVRGGFGLFGRCGWCGWLRFGGTIVSGIRWNGWNYGAFCVI
jgi:hypothetical protein